MRIIKIIVVGIMCITTANIVQAHPGIGIVMDSKGNVYYTDLNHVWKISPDGQRSIAVRNIHTHELFIDTEDNLYGEHEWYEGEATDKWGNNVWCLQNDGKLVKTIADVEGFLDNNTLVRDDSGNSYWAEHHDDYEILKIQRANGANSNYSAHRFNDIRWMYYSRHNNYLYVVDNLQLKQVSSNGKVAVLADNLKTDDPPFSGVADRHYVFGIWTDNSKNVYLALYGAKRIIRMNPEGNIATIYESPAGWSPCGGLVAPDGTIWLMEFSSKNETRVKKL